MELDFTSDLINLDAVLPSLTSDFSSPLLPTDTDTSSSFIGFPLGAESPTITVSSSAATAATDSQVSSLLDDTPFLAQNSHHSHKPHGIHGIPPAVSKALKKRAPSNVSHTRRCRAKVNSKLQDLLTVLPEAARAAGVLHAQTGEDKELDGAKHKAQILGLTISRYHALRIRNNELEMKLAMSSPHHMRRWVRSIVHGSIPFISDPPHCSSSSLSGSLHHQGPDIVRCLKSFMALICVTRSWKYAELWQPEFMPTGGTTHLKYISGAFPQTLTGEETNRLRKYRASSRKFKFVPRSGVPGRVFLTKRPEWLPSLDDPIAFPRAPHAVEHQVQVTFAVPVIIRGEVSMVVEFYDTVQRGYDPAIVNIANEVAVMFGNCFEENLPSQHSVVCEVL